MKRDGDQAENQRNYLKSLAYNMQKNFKFHANIWCFEKKYRAKSDGQM